MVCDYNRLRYILFFSGDFDIDILSKPERNWIQIYKTAISRARNKADEDTDIGLCRVVKIEDKEQRLISEIAALNIPIIDHTSDEGFAFAREGNQERAEGAELLLSEQKPLNNLI